MNFYSTGTSTRKDTFSDSALTSANANPVVADSSGRFADIFLESGTYKVVLTDEDDVVKWTADPVDGAIGSSGAVDEKTGDYTITVADATKIIAVDASSAAVTITLLASATAGDGFELTVLKTDSSVNAVTIDGNGSETIDTSATLILSAQYQGASVRSDATNWLTSNRYAISPNGGTGTDIASATPTVGNGFYFDVTGTTTITAFTVAKDRFFVLQFDGAVLLTHHATNLNMPGGVNYTTVAGDRLLCYSTAASQVHVVVLERNGIAQANQTAIEAETNQDTYIPPDLLKHSPGMAKFWCKFDGTASGPITPDVDYNVVDVTDNGTGDYTINIDTDFSGTHYCVVAMATAANPGTGGVSTVVQDATSTPAAGTFRVQTLASDASAVDTTDLYAAGFGDQ